MRVAPALLRPRTSAYRTTMLVVAAGGLVNFALLYYVQPLLPALAHDFGVAPADSGLALSVCTLGMLAGLVITGPLADRLGRTRVMAASLVIAGALSLLGAFAPSWPLFLAARAAAGIALAGFPSIALATLRERIHEDAHARANATYIAATAVGGALARVFPGPLAAVGGWRLPTYLFGAVTVLIGVFVVVVLRGRENTVRTAGASGDLGATFRALADRRTALLCLLGGVNMAVFVGVYNAVAFRLEAAPFTLGASEALVYLAYPIGILAPAVFRLVSTRFSRRTTAGAGAVLLAVAVAVLIPSALPTVLVGLGILTFGFLGTHGVLSAWVVDAAHRAGRSTTGASSAYLLVYYLGSTVAGAASTSLWSAGGWAAITGLGFVMAAVSGILVAALRSSERRGRSIRTTR
ncbi:hypothetical protein LK09_06445 [Microbacterium mangrovi]|uniref:Major facilitator superfamily (MFS) profile domain-containing protein n=1 Tax=Microbacterium mangrovi TaxID=1348253 RepID=A0A0B2A7D7_9MICO|nr:hypothetical protein LK09_06445 [Microbacterium mangrovi]